MKSQSPRVETHRTSSRATRGFTLVELLIVLGIIAVLISLVVVVGRGVSQSAKRNATLNTLQLLDQAMAAWVASEDATFPRQVATTDAANAPRVLLIDGVGTGEKPINTIGFFLREASKVPRCQEILAKIPAKYLRSVDVDGTGGDGPQPSLPTVFDAWDRPIRMVLPFADGLVLGARGSAGASRDDYRDEGEVFVLPAGATPAFAQYRRNNTTLRAAAGCVVQQPADSDGGRCVGNAPYFYSVGPDGLAGQNTPAPCDREDNVSDNVYSVQPAFPSS
jgi:prepilin-type N-terminal cleavage/methylation domain-containing protein